MLRFATIFRFASFARGAVRIHGIVGAVEHIVVHSRVHIEHPFRAIGAQQQYAQLDGETAGVELAKRQAVVGGKVVELVGVVLVCGLRPVDAELDASPARPDLHVSERLAHLGQAVVGGLQLLFPSVPFYGGAVGLVPRVFLGEDGIEEVALHVILRPSLLIEHSFPLDSVQGFLAEVALVGAHEEDPVAEIRWDVEAEPATVEGERVERVDLLVQHQLAVEHHLMAQTATVHAAVTVCVVAISS